jgi:hypothetical protein
LTPSELRELDSGYYLRSIEMWKKEYLKAMKEMLTKYFGN